MQLRQEDRRATTLALGLALFALAAAIRLANYGFVFVAGRVRFPSGRDELYHVRRIVYGVARFPERLDFDPYVSFPFGARPVWPPYFDAALAALARLFVPAGDAEAVECFLVFVPPLLGALTVLATAWLARCHFGWGAGLAAGGLLAFAPTHHAHSQLGQVDHQVLAGLLAVGLLLAALRLLASPAPGRGGVRAALLVGAGMAASLLVTPGALLQILPVQAGLALWALCAGARDEARGRLVRVAWANGAAALLVAPACLASGPFAEVGPYSPFVLSRFQPLWFGANAFAALALVVLWQSARTGGSRGARVGSALGLAAAAAGAALALLPGLRAALAQAGGWFTGADAALAGVIELQPLLAPAGRFDPRAAFDSLTYASLLFVPAWGFLAVRESVGLRRPGVALLLGWAAVFAALALAQERFANVFAPALAFTVGAASAALVGLVRSRAQQRGLGLVVGVLLAASVAPAARNDWALFQGSRFARTQAAGWAPPSAGRKVVVEEAARWLRTASPPTQGFLDASLPPEYGVLCSWDDGHLVRYRAERPTVQDNFVSLGDRRAFAEAGRYFAAEDEELAYATARELRARYVVATGQGSGQSLRVSPHSLGPRLWLRLGNGVRTPDGAASPALARHRLVWVGDRAGRPLDLQAPAPDRVALFEIVPGAEVAGAAPPGARIEAELVLRAGRGRLRYRAEATASAAGRYALRLPYPTDAPFSPAVRAEGEYRLRAGEVTRTLALREADVAAGAAVTGPSLEGGAP